MSLSSRNENKKTSLHNNPNILFTADTINISVLQSNNPRDVNNQSPKATAFSFIFAILALGWVGGGIFFSEKREDITPTVVGGLILTMFSILSCCIAQSQQPKADAKPKSLLPK